MNVSVPELTAVLPLIYREAHRGVRKFSKRSIVEFGDLVNEFALVYYSCSDVFDMKRGASFLRFFEHSIRNRVTTILRSELRKISHLLYADESESGTLLLDNFPAGSTTLDLSQLRFYPKLSSVAEQYFRAARLAVGTPFEQEDIVFGATLVSFLKSLTTGYKLQCILGRALALTRAQIAVIRYEIMEKAILL